MPVIRFLVSAITWKIGYPDIQARPLTLWARASKSLWNATVDTSCLDQNDDEFSQLMKIATAY